MLENGVSRTYQEAFAASKHQIQLPDSDFFDDDGRPKRTGNQIASKIKVF